MSPKLKAVLAAVGWSALVASLQALEGALEPPYSAMVGALIAIIAGFAKYSPQSAVVMNPPENRAGEKRVMGEPGVIEPSPAGGYSKNYPKRPPTGNE